MNEGENFSAPTSSGDTPKDNDSYSQLDNKYRLSNSYNRRTDRGIKTPEFFSEAMNNSKSDMIIRNHERKANKKLFIFAAVAVVAIIVIIGLILSISGRSNAPKAPESFNRFANYILTGEDKNEALPESYDPQKIYKVTEVFLSDDYDVQKEYYTKALDLYSKITVNEGEENSEKAINISEYRNGLILSFENELYGDLDMSRFFITYIQRGKGAAIVDVNNHYSQYSRDYSGEYIKNMTSYYVKETEAYEILRKEKCITGVNINRTCASHNREASDLEKEAHDYYIKAYSELEISRVNVTKGLWRLQEALMNGSSNE